MERASDDRSSEGWDRRKSVVTAIALISLGGMILATRYGALAMQSFAWWVLYWIVWPVTGWMILVRRPGNRVGRLALGIGAMMGLAFVLQAFVYDVPAGSAAWLELGYTILSLVPWLMIVETLNRFPTGDHNTRWERILGWFNLVITIWVVLGFTVNTEPLPDTGQPSPLAVPALAWLAIITRDEGFFLIVALGAFALILLFLRARKSTGVERQQFRWLVLGGLVFVLDAGVSQVAEHNILAVNTLVLLGGWAIPFSIGVAIVRYRLYEIDRILSRTVSYVIVVGLLAVLFFAGVTALSSILPTDSPLAVAGSTLAVAGSFNPLRRRVQAWVDSRFNRSRYDAAHVVDRFVGTLQTRLDGSDVVDGWIGVVSETMQPAAVSVWVRNAAGTMGE